MFFLYFFLLMILVKNYNLRLLLFILLILTYLGITSSYDLVVVLPIMILFIIIPKLSTESYLLSILFLVGALLIINYNKFSVIWLGIEIQSFSLISSLFLNNKLNLDSLESVFKYFLISCIASSLIVLFITLIYLNNLNNTINLLSSVNNKELLSILMVLPLLFKLGLFPFHIWITDVYMAINLVGIYLISILPKITSLLILLRIPLIENIVLIIAVISLFLGAIYGINQNSIKLLIGFSGIIHVSIIIISIYSKSNFLDPIPVFYLICYIISIISFLSIIIYLNNIEFIYDFFSFFIVKKFIIVLSLISILSLLGFPPLIGFWAKLYVLISLAANKKLFLCFSIILVSLISSFFYIRLLNLKFNFENEKLNVWDKIILSDTGVKNEFFYNMTIMIIIIIWLGGINLDLLMKLSVYLNLIII